MLAVGAIVGLVVLAAALDRHLPPSNTLVILTALTIGALILVSDVYDVDWTVPNYLEHLEQP